MKRRYDYRDPTANRADTSSINHVLATLNDLEVTVFILSVVLEQPLATIARLLRRPDGEVAGILRVATSRLRHPSHSTAVSDEFGQDGKIAVSAGLRSWARELSEELVRRCPRCGEPFLPHDLVTARGGRPRLFCSNACRQAAYRMRRKAPGGGPKPQDTAATPGFRYLPALSGLPTCAAPRALGESGFPRVPMRCLLFATHEGPHLALRAPVHHGSRWLCWTDPDKPAWMHAICGLHDAAWYPARPWNTESVRCCVLPLRHSGAHLRAPVSAQDSESPVSAMDRSLFAALRRRLGLPQWLRPPIAVRTPSGQLASVSPDADGRRRPPVRP
ncbi:hypothetical protein [Streptomyces monomycini]|uniref:hypothetical protein n=1 Tax=Streptomyces monomycini TaxID=371720 RepID=UPI0012FF545B|nr:hypothetical protein [Streptomyces monomycini]